VLSTTVLFGDWYPVRSVFKGFGTVAGPGCARPHSPRAGSEGELDHRSELALREVPPGPLT
jgi:hypothetical protein